MLTIEEAQKQLDDLGDNQYLRQNLAKSTADTTMITLLSRDESARIRRLIAQNPATPAPLLHELATARKQAAIVVKAVLNNPNASTETINHFINTLNVGDNKLDEIVSRQDLDAEQLVALFRKQPHGSAYLIQRPSFPLDRLEDVLDGANREHLVHLATNPRLNQSGFMFIFNNINKVDDRNYNQNYILTSLLRNPQLTENMLFALLGLTETFKMEKEVRAQTKNSIFAHPNFPLQYFRDYAEADEDHIWGFAMNPNINGEIFEYILHHPSFPSFDDGRHFDPLKNYQTNYRHFNDRHHERLFIEQHRDHTERSFLQMMIRNKGLTETMAVQLVTSPMGQKYRRAFQGYVELPDAAIFAIINLGGEHLTEFVTKNHKIPRRILNRLAKDTNPAIQAALAARGH